VVRTLAWYAVSKTETAFTHYCFSSSYCLERRSANGHKGALLSLQVKLSSTQGSSIPDGDRRGLKLSFESTGNWVNRREHLAPTVGPDKTRSYSQSCWEPPSTWGARGKDLLRPLEEQHYHSTIHRDHTRPSRGEDRFQVDLAASQANNEKLRRTNMELHRNLQNVGERTLDYRAPPRPAWARPMPFSQVIMDIVIPATQV